MKPTAVSTDPGLETVLQTVAPVALFFLVLSLVVAVQARRRGYPLLAWLLAGLSGYGIFLLILLGVMPDLARKRQRVKEMEDLESRLRKKLMPRQVGDGKETLPFLSGRDVQRSVGDQITRLPERSLGDDETRL
jgi:hypothetical protein